MELGSLLHSVQRKEGQSPDMEYAMSIIGKDSYGNALKACDFGCGGPGSVPLDDVGAMHGCMPCVLRAARRQCVRRLIKIEQRARGISAGEAARIVKGSDSNLTNRLDSFGPVG
jgi:hypothetical protein